MKRIYLLLTFISFSTLLYSQEMTFDWVNMWSNEGTIAIRSEQMAIDPDRNVFVGGWLYADSADVDPGIGVTTVARSKTSAQVYTKFNTEGAFLWATVPLEADDKIRTEAMVADSLGNLFVTGYFYDTLFAEVNGIAQVYPSVNETPDVFLAKINPEGTILWIKTMGGIYDDKGNGLDVDPEGNIYLAGYFADSVQFDPNGTKEFSEYYDLYVTKYNNDGEFQWLYRTEMLGVYNRVEPVDLVIDKNRNITVFGNYRVSNADSLDFEQGPSETYLSNDGTNDMYVIRLDQFGTFQWVKAYQGKNNTFKNDVAIAMTVDIEGSILLTGKAQGTHHFNPSNVNDSIVFGPVGFFVLKLDSSGDYNWVNDFNADNTSSPYDIAVDTDKNVFFQGYFNGIVDFDPSASEYNLTQIGGASNDIFLAKYDPNGNFSWAERYGTGGTDEGVEIATDKHGNLYGTCFSSGSVSDSILFGDFRFDGGARDFIYKMTPCGNELAHQKNDTTLYAESLNGDYQWIDCDNPTNTLTADTNRFFSPTVTGNYAVVVNSYNCQDTSSCLSIQMSTLSINETNLSNQFTLFPNPTSGQVSLKSDRLSSGEVSVLNIYGQTVMSERFSSTKQLNLNIPGANGLYFLKLVLDDKNEVVLRVIKN